MITGLSAALWLRLVVPVIPQPAAILGLLLGAGGLGLALFPVALLSLWHFHHRGLIALLTGALGAALAPLAAAGGLLCASLLAPWLRGRGRRLEVRPRRPPGSYLACWTAGLIVLGALLAGTLLLLEHDPSLSHHQRALWLAGATPPLALLVLLPAHCCGRALAGRVARMRHRRLRLLCTRPSGLALLVLLTLALPLGPAALAYLDTLRLLDLRPLFSLGAALLAAGACAAVLQLRRGPAWLLLVPVLWGLLLYTGSSAPVRKAALSRVPLSSALLQAVHLVFDLDHDGVPGRWVPGGTDCDDLDADIHPGAFDWPDDGIDQNCNGHQARLLPYAPTPWPAPPPGPRRNILLVTIDTLRADHVSAYGYARQTTSSLDALAGEGSLFDSAWAHAPETRDSVPALLTGRYPSAIVMGSPSRHWPPEVLPQNRLLAEMLQKRGYHTIALLSYHYFEPGWGLSRGFDDYDTHLMTLHSAGGDSSATSGSSSRELADLAIGRLLGEAARPERPFFLWVHFYDPHYRYEPHPDAGAGFGDRSEVDLYDGEVRFTDLHLGRVLDTLRQAGLWDRTIVVVTADHGEGFGEHGIPPSQRHGAHLYRNQTRVPLVIRVPGLAPRHISTPVGHVDLVPTLLNLDSAKATEQPQLQGRSLLDLLSGGPQPDRPVFQEVSFAGPTIRRGVVTRGWHYLRNVLPDGTAELYDLVHDPAEEHDLQGLPQTALIERAMARSLAEWEDQAILTPDFASRLAGNLSGTPLPCSRPIGATLGPWLELIGTGPVPAEIPRSGTLDLELLFHSLARIPPEWRLTVRLDLADGTVLNADHDPLDGLVPLQRLRPGTYLRDLSQIAIPASAPAGPATLQLGLLHPRKRVTAAPAIRAATLIIR